MKRNIYKTNETHKLLYLHVEKAYKRAFTMRRLKGKPVITTDASWKSYVKSVHNDLSSRTLVYDIFDSDILKEDSDIYIFVNKIKNKELLSLIEGQVVKNVIYPSTECRLRDKVNTLSETRDLVGVALLAVSLDVLSNLHSVVA